MRRIESNKLKGNVQFEAEVTSGHKISMDGIEVGRQNKGPRPQNYIKWGRGCSHRYGNILKNAAKFNQFKCEVTEKEMMMSRKVWTSSSFYSRG